MHALDHGVGWMGHRGQPPVHSTMETVYSFCQCTRTVFSVEDGVVFLVIFIAWIFIPNQGHVR